MPPDQNRTPITIEIDAETAELLKRIAEADDDALDPNLLTELFSDRDELVAYLVRHHLSEDPAAISILNQYDFARRQETV
jgi:hypothetical protein